MLEVGKLYICEKYHLLFYPDPDTADFAVAPAACPADAFASAVVAFWSERLGKPVSCVEKNIPLLVLNNKEEYVEVLAGDREGWIIYRDWLKIKEIDYGTS